MLKYFPIIVGLTLFVYFFLFFIPCTEDHFDGSTPAPLTASPNREKYLEDMVKYLLIVVNMTNARQDVYKLSNGYAQTFSSPRLTALEKQRQFFIEEIKKDPAELQFFRENLTVLI